MKILYFEGDVSFDDVNKPNGVHIQPGNIKLEFTSGWTVNLYETWMTFGKILRGQSDEHDSIWSTKHFHFDDLDKVNAFIRRLKNTPKEERFRLKEEAFKLLLDMEHLEAPEEYVTIARQHRESQLKEAEK